MPIPIKTQTAVQARKTFDQFLLEQGFVTQKQLADVKFQQAKNKQPFSETLIAMKIVDEEKLTRARAAFFHLPYVDLRSQNLSKDALSVISRETAANYQFVPFAKDKNLLRIALTDPADLRALEALEFLAQKNKYRIELYLTSKTSYQEAVRRSRTITTEVGEALAVMQEKEQEKAKVVVVPKLAPQVSARKIAPEAPVTRIVGVIIKHAITASASDIHIEPQENDLRIRYRIDGVLHSSLVVPKVVHPAVVSRIKILSNLKIDEQRLPQDGRFHMDIDGRSVDFRVSTLPTINGEKVVMRILDKSSGVPSLPELGLQGAKLEKLQDSLTRPHGMVLVTGPTGSGKSTTLYAILSALNKVGVNIVTLEDPVEYFIEGVNQSQINPDIGLTFASGLRSILRQDPNVIMVGEIRDRETAELAVHSALTGHLVFSTLHTNNAVGAIPRLVDMGIEPFLLNASLNIIAAQRLVRKICPDCKKEAALSDDEKDMIKSELKDVPPEEAQGANLKELKMFIGAGCKLCGRSGYRGRIGIFEVMPLSASIKSLIWERQPESKLLEQSKKEGMITMKQDGLIKVLKGATTLEEVVAASKE